MTVIYLTMALTDTPVWWHGQFQFLVRRELEQIAGVTVTSAMDLVSDADPSVINKRRIGLARFADLMVVLTRFPSTEVGRDIQARGGMRKPKPTLLLSPRGQVLSNSLLGTPGTARREYASNAENGKREARLIFCHVREYLDIHT
jgi:hypothetical protein